MLESITNSDETRQALVHKHIENIYQAYFEKNDKSFTIDDFIEELTTSLKQAKNTANKPVTINTYLIFDVRGMVSMDEVLNKVSILRHKYSFVYNFTTANLDVFIRYCHIGDYSNETATYFPTIYFVDRH